MYRFRTWLNGDFKHTEVEHFVQLLIQPCEFSKRKYSFSDVGIASRNLPLEFGIDHVYVPRDQLMVSILSGHVD